MPNKQTIILLFAFLFLPTRALFADEISVALTSKAFQYVPLVIAKTAAT
jgi:hypothetical protein